MKRILQSICISVTAAGLATTGWGPLVPLEAFMDGAQANAGAGTGSLGTGTMTGTFDDQSNVLSWNISWGGLTGTPTLMHFHGPALPDQNAGVQVGVGVAGPPVIGSAPITPLQANDLLAGLWYLNLPPDAHPGGEIRGQVNVVPEPYSIAMLVIGLASLAGARGLRGMRRPPDRQ